MSTLKARFHHDIREIDPQTWDSLFASGNPFVSHRFLSALESSGAVSDETGWSPHHLLIFRESTVLAAMPMYVKSHSYGEFVFDWGWADAYERYGINYYPKLLTAVPFSPVQGPRVAVRQGENLDSILSEVLAAVRKLARDDSCSGWHLLFPNNEQSQCLDQLSTQNTLIKRRDVQFQWQNRGYEDFTGFLGQLRSSRRKNIRRERRSLHKQGVQLQRKVGNEISDEEWDSFYSCYVTTYLKRSGHGGYLGREFFEVLRDTLAKQLMLVVARRESRIVATSLFLFDDDRLYGRYWGNLEDVSYLHFEACFYQGIEFCIENNLKVFDPGTQGEHKLLRGFEPVETNSFHWIADERFRSAIDSHVTQEKAAREAYAEHARGFLPFRKD